MKDYMLNRLNRQKINQAHINNTNQPALASPMRANNLIPGQDLQGLVDNTENFEQEDLNSTEEANEISNQESNSLSESDSESEQSAEPNNSQGSTTGKMLGKMGSKFIQFCIKHPEVIPVIIIVASVIIILIFIILAVVASTDAEASDSGSGGSGSYNTASATATDACAQISVPINEYLESKGSSLEEFNNYIASEVRTAGLGTRNGVVAAAVSLIGGLCQNYGGRFPYKYSGAHPSNFYGASSSWGTNISGGFTYPGVSYVYYYEGPDCSGFVTWAIHNGGYKSMDMAASSFGSLGTTYSMSDFTGQPGDILFSSGHVVMIVGVSGDNYLIAEAAGGDEGTRITPISKKSGPYQVVDMTSFYSNDANKDMASYPEAKPVENNNSSSSSNSNSGSKNIFVGDSRTVGMCQENGLCGSDKYVAEVGMGYNWLNSTAITQTNNIISSGSDKYNIYILLGANDYDYQANNYIQKINELANGDWKNHNIIFVSVNPMDDASENSKIETFNSTIKSGLSSNIKYCDTYSKLKSAGFNTTDGVHYDKATYQKIYNLIKSC